MYVDGFGGVEGGEGGFVGRGGGGSSVWCAAGTLVVEGARESGVAGVGDGDCFRFAGLEGVRLWFSLIGFSMSVLGFFRDDFRGRTWVRRWVRRRE